MNVAIVHDYLTQPGGAERVVLQLAQVFPAAPIFTSLHGDGTYPAFRQLDVRTSPLQGRVDPERFRRAALRYPRAFRAFDLSDFDAVVVSSSAFAHHVRHPATFVYCYTPPRFLYAPATYVDSAVRARVLSLALSPLRVADRRAARRARSYAAVSEVTARRVREAYGLDAPVIYPPLAVDHLPGDLAPPPSEPRALVVARLLPYKRVDVAIAACERAGIPLTVVGDGPERSSLVARASDRVAFRAHVPDEELAEIFRSHSVVLAPGVEDFGYGPVEANYAGRPVVAVRAGGACETVLDHETGVLVDGHDPDDWAKAITSVLSRSWSPQALRDSTERFSARRFAQAVKAWVGAT